MFLEIASAAKTTAALNAAKAAETKLNGLKGPATTKAQTSATNINSIFEAAKQAVENAKNNASSATENATNDINNKSSEIVTQSQENQEQLAQVVEQSTQAFTQYLEEVSQLKEQKKTIEDQIKEKGGDVKESNSDSAGDVQQAAEQTQTAPQPQQQPQVNQNGNPVQQTQTKTQTPVQKTGKKSAEKKDDKANGAELQTLYSQLEQVNGQISEKTEAYTKTSTENAEKSAEIVATNNLNVTQGQEEITNRKTQADGEIAKASQDMTKAETDATQKLSQESRTQTLESNKNVQNSFTGKTAASAARAAAATADPRDANKAELETVANSLDGLSNDFGMQSGLAKTNQNNALKATENSQQIKAAVNAAKAGDLQQFTQQLNEIYSKAMQETNQAKNIMPGGGNGSKTDQADAQDVASNGDSGNTGAKSSVTNPLKSDKSDKSSGTNKWLAFGINSVGSLVNGISGKNILPTNMTGNLQDDIQGMMGGLSGLFG